MFNNLEPVRNDKNDRFNMGYPFVTNLQTLKCPCGTDFLASEKSAFCSACATATCSSECHDKYMQKDKKCSFSSNFVDHRSTKHIQVAV